tara:strand:+ start:381 stop:653 length:273 start_codon:yes stop_codon:yes gene_type:complete
MRFTDKTEGDRIKIDAIFDKCRSIYHEYGGYEYNDSMLYHIDGLRYSMEECEEDKDVERMLREARDVEKWFVWVKKMRVLVENEPPQIYC